MRKITAYLFLALVLLSLGGCKSHRIIPKKDMVEIYADMFIADQWVGNDRARNRHADTTLLYEPIFRKYGYDTEDFRESVNYYLKDPERYARMLKKTAAKLQARTDELHRRIEALEGNEELINSLKDSYEPRDPYYISWLEDTLKLRDDERIIDKLDSLLGVYTAGPPVYFHEAVPDTTSVAETATEAEPLPELKPDERLKVDNKRCLKPELKRPRLPEAKEASKR